MDYQPINIYSYCQYIVYRLVNSAILIISPYIYFDGATWGKVINSLSKSNAGGSFDIITVFNVNVINTLTPLKAILYSFFMLVTVSFFIGSLTFLLNLISVRYYIGNIVTVFFIFLNFFKDWASGWRIYWVSPITWCDLNSLSLVNKYFPSVSYTITAVILLFTAIITTAIICGGKKSKAVIN